MIVNGSVSRLTGSFAGTFALRAFSLGTFSTGSGFSDIHGEQLLRRIADTLAHAGDHAADQKFDGSGSIDHGAWDVGKINTVAEVQSIEIESVHLDGLEPGDGL